MKTRTLPEWILVVALLLGACGGQPETTTTARPAPAVAVTQASSPPSATPRPPTPTRVPATLTATASPTASATPPHPLSIAAMRAGQYPGSELVIEEELAAGSNYRRYYASYQSEGLKIYGLLTVPSGEKPATGWPVIIFNHGYIPPTQYRTTERYIAYVDTLARNGYIVFRPDYRGHDRSEGQSRGAYSNPDYVIDVLNAVATLKRFPDADPQRMGMWGHSMGGYITLRNMVITGDIKAGVIWAGVVASYADLLTKWRRSSTAAAIPTPSSRGSSWRSLAETYGSPEENPQFWNDISANSYLEEISGPLQLHHGTADADVPVIFSESLYFQMLDAGQYVELYKYPDDNHNISNNFNTAMQRSVEFFDKYVKNP